MGVTVNDQIVRCLQRLSPFLARPLPTRMGITTNSLTLHWQPVGVKLLWERQMAMLGLDAVELYVQVAVQDRKSHGLRKKQEKEKKNKEKTKKSEKNKKRKTRKEQSKNKK